MLRFPFLASAAARLSIFRVDESWCQTAATDGFRIYWSPTFFQELSSDEIIGVLAHELMHVTLDHIGRQGSRDPHLWNVAIDHATNLMLLDYGLTLPRRRLADRRFAAMSAEEIYTYLNGDQKTSPGAGRQSTDGARRNVSASAERFDDHLLTGDARRGHLDDHDLPSELEQHRTRHELAQDLQAELAAMRHGTISGELSEAVRRVAKPRVPWTRLLARFASGTSRDDYRLLLPSKKHLWRGVYLPSLGIPGPQHIVCAIDTSGSVSTNVASKFLGELHALRVSARCRLSVLQCDARLQSIDDYQSWEQPGSDDVVTFKGRGGTDFRPVFDWIDKTCRHSGTAPDFLAYLTDCMGRFPDIQPPYPVIWCAVGTSPKVPWGALINIDD